MKKKLNLFDTSMQFIPMFSKILFCVFFAKRLFMNSYVAWRWWVKVKKCNILGPFYKDIFLYKNNQVHCQKRSFVVVVVWKTKRIHKSTYVNRPSSWLLASRGNKLQLFLLSQKFPFSFRRTSCMKNRFFSLLRFFAICFFDTDFKLTHWQLRTQYFKSKFIIIIILTKRLPFFS